MQPGHINLNGQLLPALPESLTEVQRAFLYGDGLFETIRVFNGLTPYWPGHWQRLSRGFKLLGFIAPVTWTESFFKAEIERIKYPNARIRLTVWRSPGGSYLPTDHTPQFLVTAEPLLVDFFEWLDQGLNICLCTSVQLPADTLSGLKMLGGNRYVAAAREAQSKGRDDGIILSTIGTISEATSSNVFWIKNGEVFTPAPGAGQVSGTLLSVLGSVLPTNGWKLHEKSATTKDLLDADELFLTNAIRGIRWVREFEGVQYGCKKTKHIHQLLNDDLKARMAEKTGF